MLQNLIAHFPLCLINISNCKQNILWLHAEIKHINITYNANAQDIKDIPYVFNDECNSNVYDHRDLNLAFNRNFE